MRVATYTRISTDEERQPYSLGAQATRLESYIASQDGWELIRTFTDQCSGATLDRPALQHALREARAQRFDLLLVYRVDRLARSVRGLAHILEELDGAGVAFRSATEPFDTATSAGRMMVQMLGVFAEFERATIVDRVVAGMERKAARGGWTSGTYPFGYGCDTNTGFLTPRADESPLVPLIFEMYAKQRHGARTIAAWLNQRGHRTHKGRPWSSNAVIRVIRNRAYVGDVFFRDTWHPAPHPPLVDNDLFDRAQAVLTARGDNYSLRASNPSDYILAGLVRCQRCGRHYVGGAAHGRGGRYRYYTCWSRQRYGTDHCDSDRLSASELEAAIVESLRRTFAQRPLVQKALRAWAAGNEAARPKYEEQLTQTEREVAKAEEAVERYLLAFEAGTLPESQCGDRVRSLGKKVAELRMRKEELLTAIQDSPQASIRDVDLEAVRVDIAELLDDDGDVATRKAALQVLVQEIRVDSREAITPYFRVPLHAPVRTLTRSERETRLELATLTLARYRSNSVFDRGRKWPLNHYLPQISTGVHADHTGSHGDHTGVHADHKTPQSPETAVGAA
jgi:site-specific DNA recombinase